MNGEKTWRVREYARDAGCRSFNWDEILLFLERHGVDVEEDEETGEWYVNTGY